MTDAGLRLTGLSGSAGEPSVVMLGALENLAEALAEVTPAEPLFLQATKILQAVLDLPCTAILLLTPDLRMHLSASQGFSAAFQGAEATCGPWQPEAMDPQPVLVEDLTAAPPTASWRAGLLAEGARSLAFIPLRNHGRLLGELLLCSRLQRCFTQEELRFAGAVANLVSLAAIRAQQGKAMADAVAFSDRLIETADILVVGLDSQGRVMLFNETAARATGYTKAEILGRNWFEIVVPRKRFPSVCDYFHQLRESGDVLREMETPLLTRNGEERLVSWRNSVFLEPDARIATLSFGIDVTEVHRSTEALRASEALFSKIFHLSPDAIDLTRLEDGISLDCNRSYVKLSGFSREEIIGRSTLPGGLGVWVHKEDRDRHVAELRKHGEVLDLETPLRRKDGSIYMALISSAMLEIDGQPVNLTLTRDNTERKLAEAALRESAQRLQLALASGNLGIWDRNLLDDTEIWDDRMYELYGLTPGSIVPNYNTWIEKIVHPEDAPEIQEAIRSALAGEQSYDLKFRIIRPDGSVCHIKSNGSVVRDAGGRAVRVIGLNRDRTEQVEAETERRRLQTEVHHAEKLESIGSLAGGMAHDMNNILTGILITAEMLREQCAESDPMARSLAVILHAGQRGRDLVKALTDFARKGLEDAAPVDLNEVLRKEVELLRHTTLRKIQVILDLDERLPVILGAASELGSAIMNLGINAVDAMPEGGILTFSSRILRDGWIELRVADTGQGMTPEVKSKAMEPFFTTKPVGKGTGLGLSRVYGTVRAHGGTVELHSRVGEGTTFILRLPMNPGILHDTAVADGPVPSALAQHCRILLVDDEGIILDSIPALLESMGHHVETASHGEEALCRLDLGQAFDVVILDHNMPGLTGVETLILLRRKFPELPVILSTGYLDARTEALLADIPRVWVLKKPYNRGEIQRALAEITPQGRDDPDGPERHGFGDTGG